MKAENTTTGHNRTIRFTDIPGDELHEMLITVNYVPIPVEDGVVHKAVTLDKTVIPAIIEAVNGWFNLSDHAKEVNQ